MYERCGELAQMDSEAFDRVMKSFRLPKSNDDEIQSRRLRFESTLNAAEVPFETAEHGMKLLGCLEDLASRGNGNAASDVGVASLLASAAVKGALFNVEINLQSLPSEMGESMRLSINQIRMDCSEVSRRVMHAVRQNPG